MIKSSSAQIILTVFLHFWNGKRGGVTATTVLARGVDIPPPSSSSSIHHRRTIVAGENADPERFPYYVRLEYEGEFGCGGSLITNEFILTAAHCAFQSDIGILTAIVGGHNYSSGITRKVINVYPHIAYDGVISDSNDVALLRIEPIPENLNMTTLQFRSSRDFLKASDSVTAIGLGETETGGDAKQLKEVELKILDDAACDELYTGDIHRKSMLCARDPGEDSCHGDSGGPLIVLGKTPDEDIQVGVVSWGDDCALMTKPGVYADVAYFQSWIDTVLCKYSTTPPTEGCELKLDTSTGPFLLNPDEDICRDFSGAFYADWWNQFQRCDWLREKGRINTYCVEYNEAWINCPLTCHSCTYEADDDQFFGEGNDDWITYDESSKPTATIMSILLAVILLCLLCLLTMIYFQCCKCCKWLPSNKPREMMGDVVGDKAGTAPDEGALEEGAPAVALTSVRMAEEKPHVSTSSTEPTNNASVY